MYSIHAFAALARRREGVGCTELVPRDVENTPAPAERLKIQGSARILGVRIEFALDVDLCGAASAPPRGDSQSHAPR
jgi:hypothetical protein